MRTYRLRSYDAVPPGGYSYEQTTGIYRAFSSQPLIEAVAQAVSAFRKGNGLPRSSVQEALQDVDAYTCARLGGMSAWCVDTNPKSKIVALNPSVSVVAGGARGCRGCGVPVH